MADFSEVIAAIHPGAKSSQPLDDQGVPFVVLPAGYAVHDLEKLLPAPITTAAKVSVTDVASFISYVQSFADDDTKIFASDNGGTAPRIEAVIDYPSKAAPRHARHRVTLTPRLSEQWARWKAANGKKMSQVDFARFLEENSVDIRAPNSATLIEVAKSIEATKSGQFRSGMRLQDGSFQLTYSEEVSATAGAGKLSIPELIVVGIPVFERGELYAVDARMRYRIEDGKLALWIDLHRPRFVFDDAFLGLVNAIKTGLDRTVLFGTPGGGT